MAGVVIVGSTGSFGSEFAKNVALDGKNILLVGRNEEKLRKQVEELRELNPSIDIDFMVCDLSDEHATDSIIDTINDSAMKPNELIYAAGASELSFVDTTSDEGIKRINQINITTPEILTKRFAEYLENNGMQFDGKIMITTGTAGLTLGNPNPYYGASRAAFLHASASIIANLRNRGISFTNFIPGLSRNRAAEEEFGQELTNSTLASPQKICQEAYETMQSGGEYYIGTGSLVDRLFFSQRYHRQLNPDHTYEGRVRNSRIAKFLMSFSGISAKLFGNMPEDMREEYIDALNSGDRLKRIKIQSRYLMDRIRGRSTQIEGGFELAEVLEQTKKEKDYSGVPLKDEDYLEREVKYDTVEKEEVEELTPSEALKEIVGERKKEVTLDVDGSLKYLLKLYGIKEFDTYSTQSGKKLELDGREILEGFVPAEYEESYGTKISELFLKSNEKAIEIYKGMLDGEYPEMPRKIDKDKLLKLVHLAGKIGIELTPENTSQMLTILNGLVSFENGKEMNEFDIDKDDAGIIMLLLTRCTLEEQKNEDIIQTLGVLQDMQDGQHGRKIVNNPDFIRLIKQGNIRYYSQGERERVIGEDGKISREDYDILLPYAKKALEMTIVEDDVNVSLKMLDEMRNGRSMSDRSI